MEALWEKSEAEQITGKILLEPIDDAESLGVNVTEAYFTERETPSGEKSFSFNISADFGKGGDSIELAAYPNGQVRVSRLVELDQPTTDTVLKEKGIGLARDLVKTLPETVELKEAGITISKEELAQIWENAKS